MDLRKVLTNSLLGIFVIALLYFYVERFTDYLVVDGKDFVSYFPIKPGFSFSINDDPSQIEINPEKISFHIDHYSITPVASFQLKARVLSMRRYYSDSDGVWNTAMDKRLFPIDLALGWGPMADLKNISRMEITQTGRFYLWHVDSYFISRDEINFHSSNMHIISGSQTVYDKLSSLKKGDIVSLSGYLVNVSSDSGKDWKTSLSREDTSGGACEIFLVVDLLVERGEQ